MGIGFAPESGMSPISQALHERFERVSRNELDRLRRKTAALSPAERQQVDTIALAVAAAMAARMAEALETDTNQSLTPIVERLFAVETAA